MTTHNTFGRTPNSAGKGENVVPMQQANAQPQATESQASAKHNTKEKRKKRAHQSQLVIFLNFCLSMVIFALVGLGALIYLGKQRFEAPGPLVAETNYVVRSGASLAQIAGALETRGVISNATIFEFGTRASGNTTALKSGEYAFEAGASMRDVMQTIVSGRSVQFGITVVEGTTVYTVFQRIAANEAFSGELPAQLPPEGSLLADTKLFDRGTPRTEVVDRLMAAQTALVEEIWATRQPDLPLADVNEFVTLASIVEKETGVGAERAQVASVFVNRLRRGMRLQSDPTIIYGIFGGEGKPSDRPIYRSDIDTPTEYNTYTIDALPPGPIAIPGRAALEAVANPDDTDYLFFVADGTGGHVFARTLDEHNANVAKWRQIERERQQEQETAQ
ncbi:MAG: endolytic transglycosylase MltG [Ahrensia sp.]